MAITGAHHKLTVWQESRNLAELVYAVTAAFPKSELFGLSSQLRRAAVSVPSNLAEGAARNSTRELAQFVGIANGSIAEMETQMELAARLGYISREAQVFGKITEVAKLLVGLRRSLRQKLA